MAEVLTALGGLALGVALGWRFRRRAETHAVARATVDLLAAQWAEHVEAHAQAQAGSVVMTAPEAYSTCSTAAEADPSDAPTHSKTIRNPAFASFASTETRSIP